MITVRLRKDGQDYIEQFTAGVYVNTEQPEWLYVVDKDFLTLACFPREIVVSCHVEGGENETVSADTGKSG